MKIVIDIPEEVYRAYKMDVTLGFLNSDQRSIATWNLISGLIHGKPLPKGHGDLIDVNRKITVSVYDEQYEEWGEKTLTVLEALNRWSDEGVTVKDVVIPADKEVQE